jgi:hypothetical protein
VPIIAVIDHGVGQSAEIAQRDSAHELLGQHEVLRIMVT